MSVRLVDFVPGNNKPGIEEVQRRIDNDCMMGCTPDVAALRYAGPQKVFLWDDTQDMMRWNKLNLDLPKDIKTVGFQAWTQHELMPMMKRGGSCQYKALLPLGPSWRSQIKAHEVGSFMSMQTAPIKGKVVSMSLKGITNLDRYYVNGLIFDRIKMPIVTLERSTQKVESCWMYVNKLTSIAKYDPHEQKYMLGSYFDPIPFEKQGGKWDYPDTVFYLDDRTKEVSTA